MLPVERIEQARLPKNKPSRMWGGRGSGRPAASAIGLYLDTEPEMELEFEGRTPRNPSCAFICSVRPCGKKCARQRNSPWTLVSIELPPLLHIVEARLALSTQRAIILNVMRVNHGDTGPIVWLNATTNSPLPTHWQPVEWRPVADQQLRTPRRSGERSAASPRLSRALLSYLVYGKRPGPTRKSGSYAHCRPPPTLSPTLP